MMESEDCRRSLLRSDSKSVVSVDQSFWSVIKSRVIVWIRAIGLRKKNIAIILGPLVFLLVLRFVEIKEKNGEKCTAMMGSLCWIFIWWMTGAVPIAVTSLAPLYLFPLLKIAKADVVAKSYMNDVISLVIGSFILAIAVEHYKMHKRLALKMLVAFSGKTMNPRLLLLGFCGATAFVSMWMHNVAATLIMMPVATGILERVRDGSASPASALPLHNAQASDSPKKTGHGSTASEFSGVSDPEINIGGATESVHEDVVMFCKAVVVGVVYAAAIGGMSTLTGTGVNLILVGIWQTYFPSAPPITFMKWSFFAFPLALVLFLFLWAILCVLYCSKSSTKTISACLDKSHLQRELELLGPMPFADKTVLSIFLILIILWMTHSLTNDVPGWGDLLDGYPGDGTVSVLMATLLFIIPNRETPGEKLMDWKKCQKLPWDIVLLLGAGFAIADGMKQSGLADLLSNHMGFLESAPYLLIAPIVALLSSTITEFTSNNATTTLVVPLLIQVAATMHVHPLLLMIPGAIGAQFSFLLPTGTPSNAIGFTTGYIEMKDMLKTGIPLKIAGIASLSFLMPSLGAYVFGTNTSL